MPREAQPIDQLVEAGKKHLTKEEIEHRREVEERLKPNSDKVKPPSWLSKDAKKVWKNIVPELQRIGTMTNIDIYTMGVFCDAVVKYQECTEDIDERGVVVEHTNKEGYTNTVQNPSVNSAAKYAQIIKSFCAEFGLSPRARAGIALPVLAKKVDPFEEDFPDV